MERGSISLAIRTSDKQRQANEGDWGAFQSADMLLIWTARIEDSETLHEICEGDAGCPDQFEQRQAIADVGLQERGAPDAEIFLYLEYLEVGGPTQLEPEALVGELLLGEPPCFYMRPWNS